jgi:hypothetical protein
MAVIDGPMVEINDGGDESRELLSVNQSEAILADGGFELA